MNSVAPPDYDDYFAERGRAVEGGVAVPPQAGLPFESSRGCWWGQKKHCTFCGLNNEGMSYRSKSAERVVREVTELVSKYQTPSLMAADNILDARGYADLLPRLADVPIDLELFYEIKANVTRDQVAALAAAVCGGCSRASRASRTASSG
jgi:radical SAM superfamily enzyme YgiQ (UPF0313 family)